MAAGLGFKTFAVGEVLTAADTNGYLMQGVLVFANATARDAAITSPQEGQFAYLKDTNVTTYYTGSAWANLDTTGMVNPMTTTGDTIYSSSGSTPARLGIGSTGNVLTVAGGVPTWAAPSAGGGYTLLDTKTFDDTVTNYTFTSIAGTYKHLFIVGEGLQSAVPNGNFDGLRIQYNADTGSNYYYAYIRTIQTSVSGDSVVAYTNLFTGLCMADTNDTAALGNFSYFIPNYSNTSTFKSAYAQSFACISNAAATTSSAFHNGVWNSATAITSIKLTSSEGYNLKAGTLKLYGVS
jgi:hypothetical protein